MQILFNSYRRQIDEISADPVLWGFGIFLSLGHLLSALYFTQSDILKILSHSDGAICWSFWPNCFEERIFHPLFWKVLFGIYILAAIVAVLGFSYRRISWAWWALLIASGLKLMFMIQDYGLMGNHHHIQLWVCFPFLFARDKVKVLGLLLPLLYVLAGSLRLGSDWLQGLALVSSKNWIPFSFLKVAAIYTSFLELCIVWWFFSKSSFLRWAVLTQFVAFHLISSLWVGYYFPSVMLLLLAFFPLLWGHGRWVPLDLTPLRFASSALFLFLPIFCQILSLLPDQDSALFSRRRVASLSMFDARTECSSEAFIQRAGTLIHLPLYSSRVGARLHCDPVYHEGLVQRLCREEHLSFPDSKIRFILLARRLSDSELTLVEDTPDACGSLKERSWWESLSGRGHHG